MTLNGIMAVTLRFLVCVQCCRKESSRSLSHLLMSFLFSHVAATYANIYLPYFYVCKSRFDNN